MTKCIVFPDTNVFLHFPTMREMPWLMLAQAKSVELVICMTVIKELDAKKSDSRLGSRAERAIREIREARNSDGYIRDGVTLRIFNREIRNADFSESLSPDSADDRIVHFAKVYLAEHPGNSIAIATGDMGMELRAEAAGVSTIVLGPELRLGNPQDELSKKYREAITELNSLKNRLPKLSVGLSLPGDVFSPSHTVIFGATKKSQINIHSEMEGIRHRYPKYSKQNKNDLADYGALFSGFDIFSGSINETEWNDYNSKLDKFYENCEKHFALVNEVREIQSRAFTFDLWLSNGGSSRASDIDVRISFPEAYQIFERGSKKAELFETQPPPPIPPKKPTPASYLGIGNNVFDPLAHIAMMARTPHIADILRHSRQDEWTPEVSVTDGQNCLIHIRLGKLKHGDNTRLGSFLAVLSSDVGIKSFGANYVVSCSDLPSKIEDRLQFRLNVNESVSDQYSSKSAPETNPPDDSRT